MPVLGWWQLRRFDNSWILPPKITNILGISQAQKTVNEMVCFYCTALYGAHPILEGDVQMICMDFSLQVDGLVQKIHFLLRMVPHFRGYSLLFGGKIFQHGFPRGFPRVERKPKKTHISDRRCSKIRGGYLQVRRILCCASKGAVHGPYEVVLFELCSQKFPPKASFLSEKPQKLNSSPLKK